MRALILASLSLISFEVNAIESPYVFLGIDYELHPQSLFCRQDNDTSNIGMGQTLWRAENRLVEINWQYTHHSCISEFHDRNVYDAVGVYMRVYLWNP